MTAPIIIIAIKLMAISSSCSADLNILSIITRAYESNVKSLRNFFHLNQDHSNALIYDNDISYNINEIDDGPYWQNYRRKENLYNDGIFGSQNCHCFRLTVQNAYVAISDWAVAAPSVIIYLIDHILLYVYQYDDYYTNFIPDSEDDLFTPLTAYEDEQERRSNNLGFFNTILKLFGFHHTIESSTHSPVTVSNRTKGLDVRLKSNYFTKRLLKTMKNQFKLIYPGTLWCGGGTLARDNMDYGFFRRTDKCCWKHDSCPKYIAAGEKWKNLENVGIFTRSHCDCERDFYTCLKGINSFISNKIGVTYFNVLRPQCFRKEYPIVSCLERRSDSRCFNYVVDNNKPKQWQWFDNKIY